VLQRILTPELCPDEVFYAAFATLAAGVSPGKQAEGTAPAGGQAVIDSAALSSRARSLSGATAAAILWLR
jgi:hypothetical protein